ncbi:MAG TPA: TIGR01777 family oxidoreductase [Streptosporangiaceae bacterium]|nr:TIGR01777 family oxidoreductase [Streptosporangiaceae bacterium]
MRIAISGGSGLIGSALGADLRRDTAAGAEVVRLVRGPARAAGEISWDPVGSGLDPAALDGVDAVVHLSGAPVAGKRWTAARKAQLRASRIDSTRALVTAMTAASAQPGPSPNGRASPGVLVCGSAIGFYGDTAGRVVDESSPPGTGFLADLVRDWEAAAQAAAPAGIRVVSIRSGIVLARRGGMLGQLMLPFKLGLGARIGSGSQYLSWISLSDEVRAIRFVLDHAELSGPVNLTAPTPVTNAEFTSALARALGRPALLTAPAPVMRAALGEVATELLGSIRAVPAKLTGAGFTFKHPDIATALSAIVAL